MLTRIVKLEVNEGFAANFPDFFKNIQSKIRAFDGCISAELLKDLHNPCVFFTISIWSDEASLNNYRDSELFIQTWKTVKLNFTQKALAWSLIDP